MDAIKQELEATEERMKVAAKELQKLLDSGDYSYRIVTYATDLITARSQYSVLESIVNNRM